MKKKIFWQFKILSNFLIPSYPQFLLYTALLIMCSCSIVSCFNYCLFFWGFLGGLYYWWWYNCCRLIIILLLTWVLTFIRKDNILCIYGLVVAPALFSNGGEMILIRIKKLYRNKDIREDRKKAKPNKLGGGRRDDPQNHQLWGIGGWNLDSTKAFIFHSSNIETCIGKRLICINFIYK